MTPIELSLRLAPHRRPKFWVSALVTLATLTIAIAIRLMFLGPGGGGSAGSAFFPALIIIGIYAGWRWGLSVVAIFTALALWMLVRQPDVVPDARTIVAVLLFYGSAAITVVLAGAVRELLVRLSEEIQAREAAEGSQKESEIRFRTLADAAPTLMWVTRPDGERGFVNRAYTEFMGGTTEEAMRLNWRSRIHPDDEERISQAVMDGETSGEPFAMEARYRRADGEYRWLRSISRPRFGADGGMSGYIGIAFDITDAKQAQADLRRINELLAERVEAALAERDQAQSALMQAQKMDAVGQLTGGVAHDFNNLLAVIIGALDIVARKPEDVARRTRMLEAALTAAHRGEALTRRLLAFSRQQPQRAEARNIDDLVRDAEPLLIRAVGEGVSLKLDLQSGGGHAEVDPGQFEAAILNLALNARDALDDTGNVVISTARVRLAAEGERPAGDYICAAVSDDGPGMDEQTKARVFEPFFTTKPVGKGTGLGLSQVYGFSRQSQGRVEIDSAPGQGATIRILLPLVPAPAAEVDQRPERDAPDTEHLKVLLVEDDPEVAELVEAMLEELGHTVVSASDARGAINRASLEPDLGLMLTDVIMPGGKNGVELAHEITRLRPGLPVILSSGYTGETLAGAEQAPWPLLRKPYTIHALSQMIGQTLHHSSVH